MIISIYMRMRLNQVLVVYKQVSNSDVATREKSKLHLATLNELYELLKGLGISFDAQSVRQLKTIKNAGLVITVGGDGTVLTASHYCVNTPILGIKSFGRHSVGFFCAATRQTMEKYIKDIIAGRKKPIQLHRLKVAINGQPLAELALNDVLFANTIPASTSRYKIIVGAKCEDQKSSGVWFSTAAGSTAAVKSAGGKVLPLKSDKMEYFVREPYEVTKPYKVVEGVLPARSKIKIVSSMREGSIYIDGGSSQYPAPAGSTVTISGANKPLNVYWR